jgi:hypothetical protein
LLQNLGKETGKLEQDISSLREGTQQQIKRVHEKVDSVNVSMCEKLKEHRETIENDLVVVRKEIPQLKQ